ncbi:hypothetical protein BDZ97DRAFT_1914411 [Flammula alnicola]|nr:hypothetical protein BDZ97DRAFT_1914411 [Flammula alnicola]
MHRALQIQDIIREICEHIFPTFEPIVSPNETLGPIPCVPDLDTSRTLLSMCMTCRAFSEPALDKLWWGIDDLWPLFKLIPALSPTGYLLRWPLTESDLAAFDHYATRVHFYHSKRRQSENLPLSTCIQIMQSRNEEALLPSLLYLRADIGTPDLHLLLSPSLRALYAPEGLAAGVAAADLQACVNSIPRAALNLQFLDIQIMEGERCLDAICATKNLKYLRLGSSLHRTLPLTPNFLEKLSTLPRLSKLIFLDSIQFPSAFPQPSPGEIFPSLESVAIHCRFSSVAQFNGFLSLGNFLRLKRLDIRIHNPQMIRSSEDLLWQSFFEILRRNTTAIFHSLSITTALPISTVVHGISISSIPDLFHLQLTDFEIGIPILQSVSYENILNMADSWPNLTRLVLTSHKPWNIDCEILTELANRLPHLRTLQIGVDAQRFSRVNHIPVLNHPLESLALCDSPIRSAIAFARLIDRIFPNVEVFEYSSEYLNAAQSKLWKDVDSFLHHFKGARQDQMRRISTDVRFI